MSTGCLCAAAKGGVPRHTGTKPLTAQTQTHTLTAEGITVGLGEMGFVITGKFPITAPKAIPSLGCKEPFNVLTQPKVSLIKDRQCTLVWLQVWLAGC